MICVGPLAGTYIEAFEALPLQTRPNFWAIAEMPIEKNPLPTPLLEQIRRAACLYVAEEHVRRGSFASELAMHLAESGERLPRLVHFYARAHHYKRYGSQPFLRKLSQLDPASMLNALSKSQHD